MAAGFGGYRALAVWDGYTKTGLLSPGLIGIGIGVVVFVAMYKDVDVEVVEFNCHPWQAPSGGNDCEICNDGSLPCSEYRCRALGQNCEIVNEGTADERCVNVNPRERFIEDTTGTRYPIGDDATALLTSPDGKHFQRFKYVFEPTRGAPGEWGHFRARINSIIYLPPVYVGFTDMGRSTYDSYEEWSGIAISHDLERWIRVTTNGPWIISKYGGIRYIDALQVHDEIWYYYEYTREDGSHELRLSKVKF